jgi:hypothetical protein
LNVYNTYTDNSNYERGFLKWSGNLLQLGTEKGGTGTGRGIQFLIDGMVRYTLYGNQLTPEGNNTQDLGTATKAWKNIYAGTKVEAPVLNATTEVQVAGVPQAKVVARVALTGQTAAIPETALFTPDGVHQYRVTTSLMITQTTATAGTVGGVYIKYNNGLTDRSDNTNTAMNANAVASASSVLSVAAGSSKPVGYSVSYSATGGSCIYCLYLVVEQWQ